MDPKINMRFHRCDDLSAETGGCSDPSDLDVDLRAELDSSASSCEFPCNCIASGNQIAHKLGVKTAAECGECSRHYYILKYFVVTYYRLFLQIFPPTLLVLDADKVKEYLLCLDKLQLSKMWASFQ